MEILKIFDRLPELWKAWFLHLVMVSSTAIAGEKGIQAGAASPIPILPALILSLIVGFLWLRVRDRVSPLTRVLGIAVVLSLPFILTGILMNRLGSIGFPAISALFFGLVLELTHRIELRVRAENSDVNDLPVHAIFRVMMNWISSVLFIFGVVSLWPWLGEIYGNGYLWVLILGVISPILFFWGRLRQPKQESSLVALYRFNRILPYIFLIMLIAFAVG